MTESMKRKCWRMELEECSLEISHNVKQIACHICCEKNMQVMLIVIGVLQNFIILEAKIPKQLHPRDCRKF